MQVPYDAVMLIAFGGPASREEVRPFLERVLRGHRVPPERLEEVARHYEAVGGRSPLNDIISQQARALEDGLKGKGLTLPVYVGMRNSSPFLRETLERMAVEGIGRALGFILSPHQTEASWERYQQNVAEARAGLGNRAPQVDFCPGWHDHPLLIQAWADRIQSAFEEIAPERRPTVPLIFTAHSVPTAMAARSPYVRQIHDTSRLVAERLGHSRWSVAYQSRSGRPEEPWLEPDVKDVIRKMAAEGEAEVVVAPVGFVCDHVEILYDLDMETKGIAEDLGVRFVRAGALNAHPTFIRMMAEVIEGKLLSVSS